MVMRGAARRRERAPAPPPLPTAEPAAGTVTHGRHAAGLRRASAHVHRPSAKLRPLKIVVNAGNGGAGPVIDLLESACRSSSSRSTTRPTATSPTGCPTPAAREPGGHRRSRGGGGGRSGHRLGRRFRPLLLLRREGRVRRGLLPGGPAGRAGAQAASGARDRPRSAAGLEHRGDRRAAGGEPVLCKSGHAFIKEKMRAGGRASTGARCRRTTTSGSSRTATAA